MVVAHGWTTDADRWELDVCRAEDGELFTTVDVVTADGDRPRGGGCGGPAVHPGRRIHTYWGADDVGPRTFLARVTAEVRAVVVTLSDGTREDLVVHPAGDGHGTGVAVLVYPRRLDVHHVDLYDADGRPLADEVQESG